MPTLIEPSTRALAHIVRNLRDLDREEIGAVRFELWPDLLNQLCAIRDFQWVWAVDGEPASILGAWPMWPGVWSVYAMGTDAFPARAMTKHIRRVMMPAMIEAQAHRAQCASIATHETAHRWLEGLGARRESVMPGYGSGGETFINFVWTLDDVRPRQSD